MVSKKESVGDSVRAEFDEFADNVSEMESLKHQLKILDVPGFSRDVKLIKAKMRDVNSVAEVKRDIGSLKKKIDRTKSNASSNASRVGNKVLNETKSVKRKISELENKIIKRKSNRKQLSGKEVGDVKDIPKVERQLNDMKKKLDLLYSKPHVKIDSGVGILVNTKFDLFVDSIKSELSKRLEDKEDLVKGRLDEDLKNQRGLFKEKYNHLVREFHQKYENKVNKELKKKVNSEFSKDLDNKLGEERRILIERLVKENSRRLHSEKRSLSKKLKADQGVKIRNAEKRLRKSLSNEFRLEKEKELENEKRVLVKEMNGLERERRSHNKKERDLMKVKNERKLASDKRKLIAIAKEMDRRKNKLKKEIDRLDGKKDRELKIEKKRLSEGIRKELVSEERIRLDEQKQKFKERLEGMNGKIHREMELKMKKGLEMKEREIRIELNKRYHENLKAEIEKKKLDMERHIVNQARKLFG
jgi:hypothetical protein